MQSLDSGDMADGSGGGGVDIGALDLSTQSDAEDALATLNTAIGNVADQRAVLGSYSNRLSSAMTVIAAQAQNATAAESQIRDADIAAEVSAMTKFQILQQTGMAALATSNSTGQSVLSLFR